MSMSTISSREFNQDIGKAKRAATDGPVVITDRGKPAHVLLSIDDYQRMTRQAENIVDLLAMPSADDIEFDPPKSNGNFYRPADLS